MTSLHTKFFNLILLREELERDYTSNNAAMIAELNSIDNKWAELEKELGVTTTQKQILAWQVQYWKEEENKNFTKLLGLDPTTPEGQWRITKQFIYCAYALEPEYIYADGEASHTTSLKSLTTLGQRWANLETLIGRTVTQEEIWAIERLDIESVHDQHKYQSLFHTVFPNTQHLDHNGNDDITNKFMDIIYKLSPENIWRDGEATRQEVEATQEKLQAQWQELEAEVGYSVSQEDVWDWYRSMRRYQSFMAAKNVELQPCPPDFLPSKETLNAFLEVIALNQSDMGDDPEYDAYLKSSWEAIEQQIGYKVTHQHVGDWQKSEKTSKTKFSRFSLKKENN